MYFLVVLLVGEDEPILTRIFGDGLVQPPTGKKLKAEQPGGPFFPILNGPSKGSQFPGGLGWLSHQPENNDGEIFLQDGIWKF